MKDFVPEASDPLVERLEERGGTIVGKTNTPEFGAGGNTFNAVFGFTRNPWDTRMNAGGSSGGAAVSLATGEVWLAQGSDLAGSLRTPAAYCGVVGLRPAPGRCGGGPAAAAFMIEGISGPMARDVADIALFLDAMTGWDPRMPISLEAPATPFQDEVATRRRARAHRVFRGPGRLRSGRTRNPPGAARGDAEAGARPAARSRTPAPTCPASTRPTSPCAACTTAQSPATCRPRRRDISSRR